MLTVNELFAGIGSQRAALERLGIEHKVVGIAEIDKFAIKSYEAIWGATKNYGDVSKIDKLDYADFWTYSFPCQDISVAGKQAGIEKGKTRSGLLYEVERLLEKSRECGELPKYLMLENVKNLVGKKFKPQFEEWIQRLDELGYNTYWQILNAKNYGIPQNRERVFGISIRKDIDTGYVFPEPFELKIRLKDVLEKEVDEKFYLSEKQISRLKGNTLRTIDSCGDKRVLEPQIQKIDIPQTVTVRKYPIDCKLLCECLRDHKFASNFSNKEIASALDKPITLVEHWFRNDNCFSIPDADIWFKLKELLNITTDEFDLPVTKFIEQEGVYERANRCYIADGIAPTITSASADEKVLIPQATKQGYIECNVPGVADLSYPGSKTRRGRVQENGEICPTLMTGQQDICYIESKKEFGRMGRQAVETFNEKQPSFGNTINPFNKTVDDSDNCPTITTRPEGFKTAILPVTQNYRIRKLTPKECWRLMGFADEQFQKAQDAGISNSQLYKQAGNSIVVDVLYYIFRNLFIEKPEYRVQIDDEEQLPGQISILDFMN